MDLDEELDFPNAPSPALYVVAGAEALPGGIMAADAMCQRAEVGNRAEIEAAAPNERADRSEEAFPQGNVARHCPCTDEGRPLPRQRRGLIMTDRRLDRQRQRRCFG